MQLCQAFSRVSLTSRAPPHVRAPVAAFCPAAPVRQVSQRGTLVVTAAQNAKRRQRVIKRNTEYNKVHKDQIKFTSRAVIKEYESMLSNASAISSEADLQQADEKMSKAFSYIDKAVVKGVLHKNTGARRKKKLTNVRRLVMAAAGLHPASQAAAQAPAAVAAA